VSTQSTAELGAESKPSRWSFLRFGALRHYLDRLAGGAELGAPSLASRKDAWLSAARLAFAAADDVESDPFRHSTRGLLASDMYRQALHAVLVSADLELEGRPAEDVWNASQEFLERLAVGPRALAVSRAAFVAAGSLAASPCALAASDAWALREMSRAALVAVEAPFRHRRELVLRRALLVTAAAALTVLAAYAVFLWSTHRTDLLAYASSKTSSVHDSFDAANMAFHTNEEDGPWIEFDFGRSRRFSSMTIENRLDCCEERAVPLIVEVSSDGSNYEEVARRTHVFDIWKPRFATVDARFIRLRVPRRTYLHLKSVRVHP
jgi:hypothetical protein